MYHTTVCKVHPATLQARPQPSNLHLRPFQVTPATCKSPCRGSAPTTHKPSPMIIPSHTCHLHIFVVLVRVGLWLFLLSLPRLPCSSLLLVWGCFGWLALSWLRSPPCPAHSWSSSAFWSSILLVSPSGSLVEFATARLSCLLPVAWCVVTAWLSSLLLNGNKGFGPFFPRVRPMSL